MNLIFLFINSFSLQNLLTYLALVFAYLAYAKSIEDKYDSWRALLQSFLDELSSMKYWISGEYKDNDYGKDFFAPGKHIYKLKTVAAEEIVRRGISDIKVVDESFSSNLSLFIERVEAFNSAIDRSFKISTSNPIVSEKLSNILTNLGLKNDDITLHVFENKIKDEKFLKQRSNECLLMNQVFKINKVIHNQLISNKNNQDKLSYLYSFLENKTETIIDKIKSKTLYPSYVQNKNDFLIISFIIYIFSETIF